MNERHCAAYTRTCRSIKNLSPKTITSYAGTLKLLDEWVEGDNVTELDKVDLEDFFEGLREDGYADTSVAIHFRNLRAFYNWCEREEIIDDSPMRKMGAPLVKGVHRRIVDDDDLTALLKSCGTGKGRPFEDVRDEALIRLFCEPGSPRVAEMAGIELETLDTRHTRVTLLGKGGVVRTIPFGHKTATALDRYIRVRAKHERAALPALWLGTFLRGPLTARGISFALANRCKKAGVQHIHPHLLRHTAFHHAKLAGMSDTDAEILFGWSSKSRMPAHYGASANVERAHQAARRLSVADRL